MENVASFESVDKMTWLQRRCRTLVFSLFHQLQQDHLELVEAEQTLSFGANKLRDGGHLHGILHIHHPDAYVQFVKAGSIGAAEAFIDNLWSSPDLTKVIQIFAKAQHVTDNLEGHMSWLTRFKNSLFHYFNRNNKQGSKKNILAHYDLGNDLYTRFLDKEMMYSAAVYPESDASLETAQLHKLELICQRLSLTKDDHLLEIGTGWGGMAIYAAQHYGCKVTTTTISDAQFEYAKNRVESLGLSDQITLLKKDYRELTGHYDKLVSIEMIEAVGHQYMDSFFQQCQSLLKPNGKMLIQAITIADQRFNYYLNNVDFIQRYIFPGGFLPSITFLNEKLRDNTTMVVDELHDIGLDYAKTLADWRERFLASWQELKAFGFDENFKRLWLYYFAYCEGGFLQRSISTVHLVARK